MKVNIFKCLTLSLLLCSIQLLYAGRIYDEFEDTYKITWIGNSKLISGTTDDWAQRAGDIYRLKIDDPSNYSFLVYELPENEIAHEVIVDYYSPTGLRPTLAVKNSAGEETKYVEGWDNGYPEITDKGHGLYRCTLKDNLIPEDATQVVIYLDAQSDIELLRNIVYYGDGYQAKNYNEKTNYYRVQKLLEKAESGNDITIGVIGGSMTAGANAEPMETNCYGARLKAWFESTLGIDAKHSNEDQIAPFDEWIKRYNGQIGLFGGFDVNLLSLGTYQSVYDEVLRKGTEYRRICKGYGLGSGNSIASYVSVDGFRGMIDAVKQIRRKEK